MLYDVDAREATAQLVVRFKVDNRSNRSKRERSEYDDSDEEEELVSEVKPAAPTMQCSRCGEISETKKDGCFYHPGAYLEVISDNVALNVANDPTEIDPNYEPAEVMEVRRSSRYSCCGNFERFSQGCVETSHTLTRSSKLPLDQKLVSLFTSATALEPPSVDPKAVAPAANRPGAAEDDDDVQIIGRDRLLGNANANGTVNLAPIAVTQKTFALNESRQHTFMNALGITPGSHLESDCDAELILATGWTTLVKPQSISIRAHTDLQQAPSHIKIFINKQAQINFDNCNDLKADQEFTLTEESYVNDVATLQLTARLFTKVSSLTLYITGNLGDMPTTTIRRIVFTGMAPNVR